VRGQSETQSDNDRNTPFRAAPATSDPSPLRRTMCTAEMGLAPLDLNHLDEPPPKDAVAPIPAIRRTSGTDGVGAAVMRNFGRTILQ